MQVSGVSLMRIPLFCLLVLAPLMTGCRGRGGYEVYDFSLSRHSWEEAAISAEFVRAGMFGKRTPVMPDELSILVMNATYDTLFAGSALEFTLDDSSLGDREPVTVEVCARFSDQWICAQENLRASPKRVSLVEQFRYPLDDTHDRGQFEFDVAVERAVFEGEGWEPIDVTDGVSGFIDVFVGSAPEDRIRIPFSASRGRFDLRRFDNYNDFRYRLDSELMDNQEASVQYEIFAGLEGAVQLVASGQRVVSAVTYEHRLANVEGFVRQVAQRLVQELSSFFGGRRLQSTIDAWHFDHEEREYRIDMHFQWRGSFFDSRSYRLEGELRVAEDGSDAVFVMLDGDRVGIERWNDRFDEEEVRFMRLEVAQQPQRYRPFDRRLSYN